MSTPHHPTAAWLTAMTAIVLVLATAASGNAQAEVSLDDARARAGSARADVTTAVPTAAHRHQPDGGTADASGPGLDHPHLTVLDDDVQQPSAGQRLLLPGSAKPPSADFSATSKAKYRYAISVVVVPLKGKKLGAGRSGTATMVDRIGRRMKDQTDGLVSYHFKSWQKAPKADKRDVPCDVTKMRERYIRYAKGIRSTPAGFDDTIAIFVTPQRSRCRFSGSALLGGDSTYINGLYLKQSQRLQDWIVAHELGHNLSLVHAGAFVPAAKGWNITSDRVPANEKNQIVDEYGDYMDVMGAPPQDGPSLEGARFDRWTLDTVSQLNLGVIGDDDIEVASKSGPMTIAALEPGGSPAGPMAIAIPAIADQTPTFWLLEYRPASSNAANVNYPPAWVEAGYGVRLIEYEHVSGRGYHINKVLRLKSRQSAPSVLPVWQRINLGDGYAVGILAQEEQATVLVDAPGGAEAMVGQFPGQR